jgi:ABC-type uncharacterized transport system permease subunit
MSVILVGSDQLQTAIGLPGSVGPMLQGAILFFLLAGEFMTNFKVHVQHVEVEPEPEAEPARG